jgi:hypothetical protein
VRSDFPTYQTHPTYLTYQTHPAYLTHPTYLSRWNGTLVTTVFGRKRRAPLISSAR